MGQANSIYSAREGLTLGFHGTDEAIVKNVVMQGLELKPSTNPWDWIGHGIYFFEHSPSRAMEYARLSMSRKNSHVKTPAVVGAVLDLGYCLDLMDYQNLSQLKTAYQFANSQMWNGGLKNLSPAKRDDDRVMRYLDCAVIEALHGLLRKQGEKPYDSVRGVFLEGQRLYPTSGFREKNHIQICIRNPNCIKGLFIPRKHSEFKG